MTRSGKGLLSVLVCAALFAAVPVLRASGAPTLPSTAGTPISDKWALIVGISKFKDTSINLKYSAKDARDFYNFLIQEGNFAPDHVKLLINEEATRENILSALGDKWLPRIGANPNDLVVIYISSHGSPSGMDVGGVNYIVAEDTDKDSLFSTGIPMQDLVRIIKGRVHSDRIVLILDACHSGAAKADGKAVFHQGNVNVDEIVSGTGQLVISSSLPDEVSWESQKSPNGVFTRFLIEGLRQSGATTTLGQAYGFMKEKVQDEVLRDRGVLQTPVLKSHWEGKDLALMAPPSKPRPGLKEQPPEPRAAQPDPVKKPPSAPQAPSSKTTLVKPAPVAESQQTLWNTYIEAARKEMSRRNLSEARRILAEAQREADNFPAEDVRRISTSKEIADVTLLQGKTSEAEPLYWQLLPQMERALGQDDVGLASGLSKLASIQVAKGKYDDADKLAKRALAIEEKSGKADAEQRAGTLEVLAAVSAHEGELQQAEALSRKALALRESISAPDEKSLLKNLCALNTYLTGQEKFADAEASASRALGISERVCGPNSAETADCLELYANVLNKLQRPIDAKKLEYRAKTLRKKLGTGGTAK